MATAENTALPQAPSLPSIESRTEDEPAAGEPPQNGDAAFAAFQGELLDLIQHLQCADQVLDDLQDVPEHLQPASAVVHRAVTELDRLYDRLDEWSVRHAHTPRVPAPNREAPEAQQGAVQ